MRVPGNACPRRLSYRRLFLFQCAPPPCAFQTVAAGSASHDLVGPPFVPDRHIYLIAFDFATQTRGMAALEHILSQQVRHGLSVAFVQAQCPNDLPVRHIESHQIQLGEPYPQRLAMTRKNGSRQVIEPFAALPASVAPTLRLAMVLTSSDNLVGRATRTMDRARPAHPPDGLVAFLLVHQVVKARKPVGRVETDPNLALR